MRKWISLFSILATSLLLNANGISSPHFITAQDGQLRDGGKTFRFISMNIPNLLLVEDNVAFAEENPWRLPDSFEINDALATVAAMGGTVARTYVISVQRTNDAPGIPRHVLAPGKFNETAFHAMDEVLAEANKNGVRLIIPLVDNWPWMGGRAEYAGFRGKGKDAFWTDPQIIADFEMTVRFVLTRTNTITGIRYGEDPAVLCWETGNEVDSPAAWTREISHYIKSLDSNHLVMDGFNSSVLRKESLEIPEVDIVTTHHYPGQKKSFAELIRANSAMARGKKPYVVGEFGFASTRQMTDAMTAIREGGASGGLLWSLRFRNRDGGFYWHTEPSGGDVYKAFHWPGSTMSEPYDETRLLNIVRSNAFAIRGLPEPALRVPAPPHLIAVTNAAAISWQGTVGASDYQVERAAKRDGAWKIIASDVDEAFTQYHPQFADEEVPSGKWFYRVRARNSSGISEPSNIEGPVVAEGGALVDELADFSRVHARSEGWKLANHDCRSAKEDAHRAAGGAGDILIYVVPDAIHDFRVFAFFPKEESDIHFFISSDGLKFESQPVAKESYFHGSGEYGYWKPVVYQAHEIPAGRFLKIALAGETQIGRVEISRKANP